VQRKMQAFCDFVGNRHTATRQTEHNHVVAPCIFLELPRKLPPCFDSVWKSSFHAAICTALCWRGVQELGHPKSVNPFRFASNPASRFTKRLYQTTAVLTSPKLSWRDCDWATVAATEVRNVSFSVRPGSLEGRGRVADLRL